MIEYVVGDATVPYLPDTPTVIAHVCNDQGGWGRGFVGQITRKLGPTPEAAYRQWFAGKPRNDFMCETPGAFLLGRTQFVTVAPHVTVANMIAQQGYKSKQNPHPFSLSAIRPCLTSLFRFAFERGAVVQMPRIGTELGGANWDVIEEAIEDAVYGESDYRKPVYVVDLP